MKALLKYILLLAAVALTGCATKPPLYNWGPYEDEVYAYFKNESTEEQILTLEKHAQETEAEGKQLPPGYRAHLGLLYSKAGRDGDFVMALEQEKAAFPESTAYVNKLLANAKPKPKQAARTEQPKPATHNEKSKRRTRHEKK